MYRVEWLQSALNQLATVWLQSDSDLRKAINAASKQIDLQLRTNPLGAGESRLGDRRVLFAFPLGILFRIEKDGQSVSVLRVWLFRKKAKGTS